MQISPVSFGKVVKVQAPMCIVQELADLANGRKQTPLVHDLKTIFDDRKYGIVRPFSINGIDNYLLSGKDAKYYAKHYEVSTTYDMLKKHMECVNRYAAQNMSGYMTVAHDGKTPKAIDIIR